MDQVMKENGIKIKCMEKVNNFQQMEEYYIKDHFIMENIKILVI